MIICALLVAFMFKRGVLDRLLRMERRMQAVRQGDFGPITPDEGSDEIGRLSQTFSSMTATVSDNTKMLEQMVQERTEELRRLAYRDQMTDIFNRRGFIDAFAEVQQKASGNDEALAVMLIDIDNFKAINDSFGHLAGDQVVTETARRITGVIRSVDVCGRWGGDEFIVLINGLGTRGLRSIAEVIRKAVAGPAITLSDGREVTMTLSVGACLIEAGEGIDAVVDMADAALYSAKTQGRDRVVVFDPVRNDVDQRRA
jgi:diguanylate cyclase (GGDEF)-like protein